MINDSLEALQRNINKKFAEIHARMDMIQAELDRLHQRQSEMEKRLDAIEAMHAEDEDFAPESIINASLEEVADMDQSLLDHLLGEQQKLTLINPDSTHLSLTIDLSKLKHQ